MERGSNDLDQTVARLLDVLDNWSPEDDDIIDLAST